MKILKQQVIYATSAFTLNKKIDEAIAEGWQPLGSHQVVNSHHQLRYSGMQHKDTQIESEYSQTIVLYEK